MEIHIWHMYNVQTGGVDKRSVGIWPGWKKNNGRGMHRSTAGHNPYSMFILTKVHSKNLPTR